MGNKHRRTLAAVFARPTRANVAWADVEALFVALGADVIEGPGSRVTFVLNGLTGKFHRPHPQKETDRGALASAREYLTDAGVTP